MKSRSAFTALMAALILVACVDSPESATAPEEQGDPLALSFEELARQATATGDVSRAEGFTYAALAARSGIAPSRLEIREGNTTSTYEAFVSAVQWLVASSTIRVPPHRTVTAWRRTSDGVTRIFSLTTPNDSSAVIHPLSLSATGPLAAPFAGAGGLYHETTLLSPALRSSNGTRVDAFWIAVSGFVKVKETLTGAACAQPTDNNVFSGVTCQQARYLVRFDASMHPLEQRPYQMRNTGTPRRFFTPSEQTVNGYKLAFGCAQVNARRGCG
jgi:hypothetical protein